MLEEGKSVALVSDAGTPGISDPGCVLFEELRLKDIKINVIPGACAVSAFLSVLGRESEFFAFSGFLPRQKNQQEELFNRFKDINLVFYESPNRLLASLKNIEQFMGKDTRVAVGRELTKVFEEVKVGTVEQILDFYENNVLKGEIVAMICAQPKKNSDESDYASQIKTLKKQGFSDKDIAKILSSLFDVNKNQIYKLSLTL